MRGTHFAYGLIIPAVLVLFGVSLFPVLYSIWISFTDMSISTGLTGSTFVGFSNYLSILREPEILQIGFQSLIWTISVLISSLVIGLALALLLGRMPKLSKIFLPIWVIPWVIPEVTAALVWVMLLHSEFGALNYALVGLNIISEPIAWLASPRFAMWGVVLAGIWKAFPFYMLVFHAALKSVPVELYDAARVDGTNMWQFFGYVQLPWIKPAAIIVCLLGFIWIFNWFTMVYIMTRGGPGGKTMIVPVHIYNKALNFFHFAEASSFSIIVLIFMSIFIFLYVHYTYLRKRSQ